MLLSFKPSVRLCVLLWVMLVGCSKPTENAPAAEKPAQGHDHGGQGGVHGPHDGVVAKLAEGRGFVEVKLHDDKGDIELWLALDEKMTRPLDLPLDAAVNITFPSMNGMGAGLHPRNTTHNEDENGTPNIRDGKTNYFIFPGKEGVSVDWLKGKTFRAEAKVSVEGGGFKAQSEPFTLEPHGHAH